MCSVLKDNETELTNNVFLNILECKQQYIVRGKVEESKVSGGFKMRDEGETECGGEEHLELLFFL